MPGPVQVPGGGRSGGVDLGEPQVIFANEVAKQTGIDPRVVYTWTVAEGANAPSGTGGYDFLNLRPYSSDTGVASVSPGGFDRFNTLQAAIASTVARINQPFLQKTLAPVLAKNGSAGDQIAAIAASTWDGSGHYIGPYDGKTVQGGKLLSYFATKYGAGALGNVVSDPLAAFGGGAPSQHNQGFGFGGIFGGLEKWITDTAGYALLYLALVGFSIVLALLGVLSLLGVHPRTALARGAEAAA